VNRRIVGALVAKDFKLFFRNRFFALITVLALVSYVAIYFFMPKSVDETLEVAVYAPEVPPILTQVEGQGLQLDLLDSEADLRAAIVDGDYAAGVVVPTGLAETLASGREGQLDLYFRTDTPEELRDSITVLLEELAYLQSGQMLSVQVSPEVLGRDMAGIQIPPRDRLVPLLAVLILMMETLGLASLISEEVIRGTVRALLITPMTVRGLFAAKLIMGVGLAFIQGFLFIAITGGLDQQPFLIIVAMLLGAVLVTGIGFILGAVGKEMTTTMAWGMPVILVLSVPAFGVLFPGSVSDWVRAVPSYYLVDIVHQTANFGAGWAEAWDSLLILLGFDALFLALGVTVLGRKLR
jgi:hypothetical protein